MTPSEYLYNTIHELASNRETADFEYEAIFEREGDVLLLKSHFVLYYKSQKLFTADKKEILNLQSELILQWLLQQLMSSLNTELFQLKSLEEDLNQLFFQKRLKEERKQRNQQSVFYSKSLEKQVEKELKEILKKIAEKERRIRDLARFSPHVQAVFHLRNKQKETTEVASQIGIG